MRVAEKLHLTCLQMCLPKGWVGMSSKTSRQFATSSRQQTGFSLIELIVVISVAAILATIAIPGFQSILAINDLNAAQENFVQLLKKGRGLAMSGGTIATITINGRTATLSVADNSSPSTTVTASTRVTVDANATYTFNPTGTATSGATVLSAANNLGIPSRTLTVTATGQINVTR